MRALSLGALKLMTQPCLHSLTHIWPRAHTSVVPRLYLLSVHAVLLSFALIRQRLPATLIKHVRAGAGSERKIETSCFAVTLELLSSYLAQVITCAIVV